MAKSKQYNFYVNPETEEELKTFLDSFPKMVRSYFIKSALVDKMNQSKGNENGFLFVSQESTEKEIKPELKNVSGFELDIEDI